MSDWQNNKQWQHNRIASGSGKTHWVLLGLGVLVTAMAAPASLAIPAELEKNNWPILSVLLFDLLALSLFIYAGREWRAWRRYGEISAILKPWPGQIGGAVAGYFELSQPLPEQHNISVSLLCGRRRSNGKNSSNTPMWHQRLQLQPIAIHQRQIWFHFEPPATTPETQLEGRVKYQWKLQLDVRQPGPDLMRLYDIPAVLGTQTNDAALRKMQLCPDQSRQEVEQALGLFHRPDGVSMALGPWRHWKAALFLGIFGIACLTASYFIAMDNGLISGFMAVIFGLTGLPFLLGAVWALGYKRVALLTRQRVATRTFWFFLPMRSRQMDTADIQSFDWKNTSSTSSASGTVMYYKLFLRGKDGQNLSICRGLQGENQAKAAAQLLAPYCGLASSAAESPARQ